MEGGTSAAAASASEGGQQRKVPQAVIKAVVQGDTAAAMAWLQSGGHIDATYDEPDGSRAGVTLLMCAAIAGHAQLVEALVGQRIAQIAAGDNHALALSAEGTVSSWGSAVWGCPGHGVKADQLLPKEVETLAATRVVHVSASGSVSMSVAADGRLFTWGSASAGALGHADPSDRLTPTVVDRCVCHLSIMTPTFE